ncbi:uncharacterized protein PHACADRAFT_257360 [Phanerochaete carnosa HHB-10118-sp]|uniref:Uncharacterized protein n=1 Tax=Phanerochaete carnosa (strain HHB-10118-sp) TaxID=650164 RepID=K5W435_PHACS|nr:uncharacterized protein PHACADRAFT_257360 [Phanerochaete carnosa HHB-10118-sp]EKM53880.1 hypothetical protein PHACADRAFT_257360 [Phanerochaete carnosa HHB-10118-sp]
MSMKRKLSIDFDDEVMYSNAKRPNLFAFPTSELSNDVAMSDASSDADLLTPLTFAPERHFHSRLNSNASTFSTSSEISSLQNSPSSSPCYPDFVLYPSVEHDATANSSAYFDSPMTNSPKQSVGLIQPRGTAFTHHGQTCSQIPKLRMACASGPNGQRTMWAHCEQCGAIEMVDFD